MALSIIAASQHLTGSDRKHVTPHAVGSRLLHAAEEAARHHGPDQTDAITAYTTQRHFVSGITSIVGVPRLLGSRAAVQSCSPCFCTIAT